MGSRIDIEQSEGYIRSFICITHEFLCDALMLDLYHWCVVCINDLEWQLLDSVLQLHLLQASLIELP